MVYLFKEFWKCGWEARQRGNPGATREPEWAEPPLGRISVGFGLGPIVAKTTYQTLMVCICTYLLIPGEMWTAFKITGFLFPADGIWLGKGPRLTTTLWKMGVASVCLYHKEFKFGRNQGSKFPYVWILLFQNVDDLRPFDVSVLKKDEIFSLDLEVRWGFMAACIIQK